MASSTHIENGLEAQAFGNGSDQLMKAVFNASSIGIAVIDEQGLFVEVNDWFCSLFGYQRNELLGAHHTILHPENEKAAAQEQHLAFIAGLETERERDWEGITKNGELFDFFCNTDLLLQENGQRFKVKSVRDITKQKKAQELIDASQLKYRAIINNSMHAFFLTKPDGSILEANIAACELFGYTEEELCKLGRSAIIDHNDPRTHEKLKERRQKGYAIGELTGIKKSGEHFPIEFSSSVFKDINGEERTSTIINDISIRKEQELRIHQSQEEMSSILSNTEEIFMIVDREYRLLNYNKAAEDRSVELLGMSLKRGESILNWADPERYEQLQNIYDRVLNGETIRYKYNIPYRGSGATIHLSYRPIFNEQGRCDRFMVSVREITVEENALNEIIRNQQLLQQAESIAHVGSWELDLATNKIYWSDEVFRICGYEPGAFEVTFEKGLEVIHPEDRASSIKEMQQSIEQKRDYSAEKRFLRPDGSIRYIVSKAKIILNAEGNALRLVGVFHDVTELKAVERELAISQQQYKSLFEQNPDAVVSLDLTGKFTSVNDAALLISEASRVQMLDEHFTSYIEQHEIERIRSYFNEVKNGIAWRFQTTIVTAKGNKKDISAILMPIVINHEITGVYGVLKDITTEKSYERELEFQSYLLNTIQQAVIVTKLDGAIIYWNSFAENLYGWKKEEVMGLNVMEVTPTEMSLQQAGEIMELLQKGESWSGEFAVKHKTKGTFKAQIHNSPVFDTEGKLSGIIGVSWDISKEVEARDYIKFQAELLDNVEQAVIATDMEGNIFYWNHFAEKLYGYTKQEALGKSRVIIRSSNPKYQQSEEALMFQFREGKSWSGEIVVSNKQQQEFPVFIVNSPVYNQEGDVRGIITVSYDITERKLEEQQKEFDRLDKEALINTTTDLIWSVSRDYKLIAANKAFLETIKNAENIVFKPGDNILAEGIFTAELLQFWRAQYSRALAGESFTIEVQTPAKGEMREHWDEITFNPITKKEEVIGVACRGRDISQNKLYQKKLLSVNNQLETAQQIARLGYWELDIVSGKLFWSKEVYRIFGLEESEFGADYNAFFARVHPDDRDFFQQQQDLALRGEVLLNVEHRIILHDQSIKYVLERGTLIYNEDGMVIRFEGTVQDITEQKLAEQSIRLNEEQLNLIYNSTAGIIFLLGVEEQEQFRFISMNNAGLAAMGLPKESVFGKQVSEVIPEPSLSFALNKYREAIRSKNTVVWQEETIYPAGTKVGVVAVTPVFDDDGKCIRLVGSVSDITELKMIQQSLAISQQEYKSLFDQNPDAVYSLDMEGNFLSYNHGLEKLLECSSDDLIRIKTFVPFSHPNDLEKTMSHFRKVQKGEPQTYECKAITYKGNVIHLSISNMPIVVDGVITGVYGIAKNISQQKEALQQLELSNERYAFATKATNDVIWDWDLLNDHVVRAGSGFKVMFGYDEKEANNDDAFWMKKIHQEDADRVIQKRLLIFKDQQQDFWEDEYRFLKADGEYAYVYDRGYIFRNEEGVPQRMIGATKDITQQKVSELELKELYGQLEQRASELELSNTELERFAYIASHDLQEPLRMVSSFLQLLQKKYNDSIDEKGREYIRFAVDGSVRMKRLINDLLDYSRVTTRKQKLEPVDMQQVMADVLQNLSLQIEEKQALIKTEGLPVLPIADKTQMVQLLQNLVGNALKYSGDQLPQVEISAEEREDEWLFSVQDNGIGFDQKFSDKIFVIFQRLHNKAEYSGTGIGLAICKKIVDRHAGTIYAESSVGGGSTFCFTIKKNLNPEKQNVPYERS